MSSDDDAAQATVRVYECMRGADGVALPDLEVDLPLAWARRHERVEVALTDYDDVLGCGARLLGDDGVTVMSFPWFDHAQVTLRQPPPSEFPIELVDGRWDDLEQGWWASVVEVGDMVYLADTDFDALVDSRPPLEIARGERGIVVVSGVDVHWNCVAKAAYDEAWRSIRARL